jgi:hypothetical protein
MSGRHHIFRFPWIIWTWAIWLPLWLLLCRFAPPNDAHLIPEKKPVGKCPCLGTTGACLICGTTEFVIGWPCEDCEAAWLER